MRPWLAFVFLLQPVFAVAHTCPNANACKGALQAQVLGTQGTWGPELDASCSELKFADYPHCAQFVWPEDEPIPLVIFGETDVDPAGLWKNHNVAPKHRPKVTPDAVINDYQSGISSQMGSVVQELGDVRFGPGPDWCSEFLVCMDKKGGGDLTRWTYRFHCSGLGYANGWTQEDDTSRCASPPVEDISEAKPPKSLTGAVP
jgi:hypothetical protein